MLDPLLFNIYIYDLCFCIEVLDIVSYAGDNRPSLSHQNLTCKNIQMVSQQVLTSLVEF